MTATLSGPPATALTEPPRPPLPRLTAVELRKMIDTRAGRWMLILIALSAVVLMPVIIFTVPARQQTLLEMVVASQAGVSLLLPILGILSVTSEWSQRTALTTFALVPDRRRVLAAKLLAGATLATAFLAIGLATGAAARGVGGLLGRSEGAWSLPPGQLGALLVYSLALTFIGVAFGLVLMNPALSIVLFFLLPILLTMLSEMIKKLRGAAGWLDPNRTLEALNQPGMTGDEWSRVGVTLAVWLVLPLVIGVFRLSRREVK
ncbi:hypothetical protein GCM10023085_70080 [Actinomadura viridis]|uniref:ABC-type transport system involved in multi-copper enzyme maturation permease subunit n=1 Tax=Actinomadura viridis TaxID=58110 RepID=A0A931DM52_9ACTN|nr:ABC transporter permease [Actinomadura viridis]MBG6090136.1 ABC-type transport system involved in multi-copper enzyme maturation permease subunit [Actinomadura viridis]